MFDETKRRLVHFCTHGNVIDDFVASRRKKARRLRLIIHICFYTQAAAAIGCILAAILLHAQGAAAIVIGALLALAVAFFALGGDTTEKTILYLLDLVYAVICFIVGASGGGRAFFACGWIMLVSAAAALCGFFAAYFRQYLMEFSPLSLQKSDYTRLSTAFAESEPAEPAQLMQPPPIPELPRSELRVLADNLNHILTAPTPPKAPLADVVCLADDARPADSACPADDARPADNAAITNSGSPDKQTNDAQKIPSDGKESSL